MPIAHYADIIDSKIAECQNIEMEIMKLNKQLVGNAGLYLVCFHLSKLGWNATPTALKQNTRIEAHNKDGSRSLQIQVRSLSKRDAVSLGQSLDTLMGDFWIIVNNVIAKPEYFILRLDEVKELAHRDGEGETASYWLESSAYDIDAFQAAWDRIGRGDG